MEEDLDILNISQTVMDMVEDHILICKLDGKIIFSNKAIQSYLGYNDVELKQKKFLDLIADGHVNKAKSFILNVSDETSKYESFLFKCKEGFLKLNLKHFQNNNFIYIYGNEKYVDYERIRKKLDVEIANAIKIHKRSLPQELPNTDNISFASLYIPAQELGGDLYDVFKVDNGLLNDYFDQYVCFIADVSGHGLDSAMLAIFVKDTIRSYFRHKHIFGQVLSPKEIMEFFLEEYMKEGYPVEYLVCIFLVVIDLKTNELTYCNAGFHMCPILIKSKENVIVLNKGGFPITTALDAKLYNYVDYSITMSQDMTLFLMSDGLPEQRSNNEFYEERLKKLCTEVYSLNPSKIIQEIHKDFIDFLNYNNIIDDITLVVVRLSKNIE